MMRLVVDTNVIISAALWGGVPRQFLQQAHGHHSLCFSVAMLQEIDRVFKYPKFNIRLSRLSFSPEEFLEHLVEDAIIIANPKEEAVIVDDPADNKFLACAIACNAHFIVSGDEHLLSLKKYQHIRIIEAKEALKNLAVYNNS